MRLEDFVKTSIEQIAKGVADGGGNIGIKAIKFSVGVDGNGIPAHESGVNSVGRIEFEVFLPKKS